MQICKSLYFFGANTAGTIHGLLLCVIVPCSSISFTWHSTSPQWCTRALFGGAWINCPLVGIWWYAHVVFHSLLQKMFVLVDYTREGDLCTAWNFKFF